MAVVASTLVLTSCLGDLDTLPLNASDSTSETAYKDRDRYMNGMAGIYSYLAFVGQNDPGTHDLGMSVSAVSL